MNAFTHGSKTLLVKPKKSVEVMLDEYCLDRDLAQLRLETIEPELPVLDPEFDLSIIEV